MDSIKLFKALDEGKTLIKDFRLEYTHKKFTKKDALMYLSQQIDINGKKYIKREGSLYYEYSQVDLVYNIYLNPEYYFIKGKFEVAIMESERGWGSKEEDVKYFDTIEDAKAFINEYNTNEKLGEGRTPDVYWYATSKNF